MIARPNYKFEKKDALFGNELIGMPDSIKDILRAPHYHYSKEGKGVRLVNMPVRELVEAIRNGDLDYIKKMDPKELKKYLNSSVINYVGPLMTVKLMNSVHGFTPLMLAAIAGKTDIMRYLIEQGANVMLKNQANGGHTATDYLKHYKELQEKKNQEQKAKDELGALMDDVDGKKKIEKDPKPVQNPVQRPIPPGGYTTKYGVSRSCKLDKILETSLNKLEKDKTRGKSKRQYGNGKGLDDKLGVLQEENTLVLSRSKGKRLTSK